MMPKSYLVFKWTVYSLATLGLFALQYLVLNHIRGGSYQGHGLSRLRCEGHMGEGEGLGPVVSKAHIFKFYTAASAEKGRSALDAVELMNVGMNYLREHVPMDVRIHYVVTDGGSAPNIVPDHATVWYYDRALTRDTMESVEARMLKVAQGAAMMTETELEVEPLGGCYPTLPNHVLADLVDACMREIPQEPWTEEEIAYAREINETVPEMWRDSVRFSLSEDPDTQLHTAAGPTGSRKYRGASAGTPAGTGGP